MKPSIILASCSLVLLLSACVQDRQTVSEQRVAPAGLADAEVVNVVPGGTEKSHRAPAAAMESDAMESIAATHPASQDRTSRRKASVQGSPLMHQFQFHPATVVNREKYASVTANAVKLVDEEPVSTFSIDVDTASYAVLRRHLNQGRLPPANAVRIEELINYFDYDYALPPDRTVPFTLTTHMAPTPWNDNTQLLRIGLQGYRHPAGDRPAANLVFLIDVSGSMGSAAKLPLLKQAFRLLVNQMDARDRITMVVYAGASGVVLETTPGDRRGDILSALHRLSAGGSTHGSSGIELAYAMARQSFIEQGINRVILATDGDFNVGVVDHDALLALIKRKREHGISLTTLGFGSGNYNDHLMEQLADHGNGNYAYIDNLNEARKVLVEQISSTLQTIASDVKIQLEWNPEMVTEYRLLGYENRLLNRQDFNNDRVDAGEIGAGHTVTALYEITLNDSAERRIPALRYQPQGRRQTIAGNEIAYIRLRYKKPGETQSRLLERPVRKADDSLNGISEAPDLGFAAAVAAFGEMLRGGENLQQFGYQDILQLARVSRGEDNKGYRAEFLQLVELARVLDSNG